MPRGYAHKKCHEGMRQCCAHQGTHLLVQILLQEREQQQEALVCRDNAIALLQTLAGGHTAKGAAKVQ